MTLLTPFAEVIYLLVFLIVVEDSYHRYDRYGSEEEPDHSVGPVKLDVLGEVFLWVTVGFLN
jgi:hypothetical protein